MTRITHVANGKEYEIIAAHTERGVEVHTYLEGRTVGRSYAASYETAHQFDEIAAQVTGVKAVAQLIECAKNDLELATQN